MMFSLRPARIGAVLTQRGKARGSIAGWMSGLVQALDALVFPWSCVLCGMEGLTEPFCGTCRQGLLEQSASAAASACPRCGLRAGPYADLRGGCAVCRGRSLGFDASIALGPYEGAIKDLCLRLKHEQDAWLAPWLGRLLVESRRGTLAALAPGARIVPVPLHRWRHWHRGYNQAEALAHGLARELRLPVYRPLRRIAATPKLAELGPTERHRVMRGAFRARAGRGLSGRTVLLVDDVLTTGATCGDAARALKRAGAAQVVVVVVARADRPTL
jgi:ComF family protein